MSYAIRELTASDNLWHVLLYMHHSGSLSLIVVDLSASENFQIQLSGFIVCCEWVVSQYIIILKSVLHSFNPLFHHYNFAMKVHHPNIYTATNICLIMWVLLYIILSMLSYVKTLSELYDCTKCCRHAVKQLEYWVMWQ